MSVRNGITQSGGEFLGVDAAYVFCSCAFVFDGTRTVVDGLVAGHAMEVEVATLSTISTA